MKLLVTGTRHATIADHGHIIQKAILDACPVGDFGPHHLYVGDAAGVDLIVRQLFTGVEPFEVHEFEANWDECTAQCPDGHRRPYRHGRGDYCPAAGMRRNRAMVSAFAEADGELVLPFPAANVRSSGTTGCIREARRAGLTVADPIPLTITG